MTVLIAAVVCCVLLYFLLIMPRLSGCRKSLPAGNGCFAHRGLHGGDVSENSLQAFEAAAAKGYGIELDVRLTKDGHPVVFHDGTAKRLCGRDVKIREMELAKLRQACVLPDGSQIPMLEEVLQAVAGRVPLLVEIKSDRMGDTEVSRIAAEYFRQYDGPLMMESFDPFQLRWFRKNEPGIPRGQLAQKRRSGEKNGAVAAAEWMAGNLLFNRIGQPDFVAYRHEDTAKISYRLMRKLFSLPTAVWTVRSEQEAEERRKMGEMIIFEGFLPIIEGGNKNERNP